MVTGKAETTVGLSFLFLCLPSLYLCFTDQCDLDVIRVPGDIVLSTIVSLRDPQDEVCGDFIAGELQTAAAMVWAVEKLNGTKTGISYIPGRTIGIDLADDCGLDRKAVKLALDTLMRVGSPDISTCSGMRPSNETSTVVGIIDTSTSQTVQKVLEIVGNSSLPVIASSATAAALGNATMYPSFVRTVPSDTEQAKVLLQTVKALNWTYIALVYTTDAYGKEGAHLLRELVHKEEKVCIFTEYTISPHEANRQVAKDILDLLAYKMTRTRHDYLGIVYIGQLRQATMLVQIQQEGTKIIKGFERLFWVMSEAVGRNNDLMPTTRNPTNQHGGFLTVALPSQKIADFKQYFIDHLENVIKGTSNHPLTRLFRKYIEISYDCTLDSGTCGKLNRGFLEKNYFQSDYVATAIDAVYVLATAVKNSISPCPVGPMCPPQSHDLRNLAQQIRELNLDYSKISDQFAPYEFSLLQRTVKFDKAGNLLTHDRKQSYEIYNLWEGEYTAVGSYTNQTLNLAKEHIRVRDPVSGLTLTGSRLPRSTCQASCPECVPVEDIAFTYIPGDFLIVGLFSLSSKTDGDFKCGDFRSETVSYPTLEAFLHAIKVVQKQYPSLRFGGIAFDDCYSALRAEYILSNFLSGNYKLVDRNTNTKIDPSRVVLVVGPLSSDVTLEVADMLTRLRIPQISYGATSPDLNNRNKYPYFLRIVPSDQTQAKAIADIIATLNWKYVAVIYIDNNYGRKLMETFKYYANQSDICVGKAVIPINQTLEEQTVKRIVSQLRNDYVKVIVYFGIDVLAKKLLNGFKTYVDNGDFLFVATEAWGVSKSLLAEGRGSKVKGSIVLHYDTAPQSQTQVFDHYLATKRPFSCSRCEWLRLFWQDRFKCNFEDGFTGPSMDFPLCKLKEHGKLSQADIEAYSGDQRVVATISAVYAGAKGIKTMVDNICQGNACQPSWVFDRDEEYVLKLTRTISNVTLTPNVKLFDVDGNGDMGFSIYNIQRSQAANGFVYEKVGTFDDNQLRLEKEKLVFYDKWNQEQKSLQVQCELGKCDQCDGSAITQDENPTISEQQIDDGPTLREAVIAVSLIASLAIVALIVGAVLYCRRLRWTPKAAPTELNIYQEVGSHSNRAFSISESLPVQNPGGLYHEANSVRDLRAGIGNGGMSGGSGSSGQSQPSQGSASSAVLRHPCFCQESSFIPVGRGSNTVLVCKACAGIFDWKSLSMQNVSSV